MIFETPYVRHHFIGTKYVVSEIYVIISLNGSITSAIGSNLIMLIDYYVFKYVTNQELFHPYLPWDFRADDNVNIMCYNVTAKGNQL